MAANGTLQLLRGSTLLNNSHIGLVGEITLDTQTHRLRTHDGVTSGGFELALMSDIPAAPNLAPYARKDQAETFSSNVTISGRSIVGSDINTGYKSVVAGGFYALNNTVGLQVNSTEVKVVGNLLATGDITSNSDIRLKSNIETIGGALDMVKRLRGTRFDMAGKRKIGVIAQEVLEVVPEVVNTEGEYMSVAYQNLVALLIEAVKELADGV